MVLCTWKLSGAARCAQCVGQVGVRLVIFGTQLLSNIESCAAVQVLVLPIFWNQRPDEKRRVLECCEHATQLLEAAGFTHHVDKSGHYTPGQKMRHWCGAPAACPCNAACSVTIVRRRATIQLQFRHFHPFAPRSALSLTASDAGKKKA